MKKLLLFTIIIILLSYFIIDFSIVGEKSGLFLPTLLLSLLFGFLFCLCYLWIFNYNQKRQLAKKLSEDIRNFGMNELIGYEIKEIELFDSSYIKKMEELGKIQIHDMGFEKAPIKSGIDIIGYLQKVYTLDGKVYQFEYKIDGRYFYIDKLENNLKKLGFVELQSGYFKNPVTKFSISISEYTDKIIVSYLKILNKINKEYEKVVKEIY